VNYDLMPSPGAALALSAVFERDVDLLLIEDLKASRELVETVWQQARRATGATLPQILPRDTPDARPATHPTTVVRSGCRFPDGSTGHARDGCAEPLDRARGSYPLPRPTHAPAGHGG